MFQRERLRLHVRTMWTENCFYVWWILDNSSYKPHYPETPLPLSKLQPLHTTHLHAKTNIVTHLVISP